MIILSRRCALFAGSLLFALSCRAQDTSHFYGQIMGFSADESTNDYTVIKYQITGDTETAVTNWYWWSGTTWAVTTGGFANANISSEVNSNITSFYEQVYPNTGGSFRWKAFLHSDGGYNTELRSVSIVQSVNRIM